MLIHSTTSFDTAQKILEEGLYKGDSRVYNNRRDVLNKTEITDEHLKILEKRAIKKGQILTHYIGGNYYIKKGQLLNDLKSIIQVRNRGEER